MALVRRSSGAVRRRNSAPAAGGALINALTSALVSGDPEMAASNYIRSKFWDAVQNPAKRIKGVDIDAFGNVVYAPRPKRKSSKPPAIEYKRKRPISFPMVVRTNVRRRFLRAKRYTRKGKAKRKRGLYPKKWAKRKRTRKPRTARRAAWRGYKCARKCWGILAPTLKETADVPHVGEYVPSIHLVGAATFHTGHALTFVSKGDTRTTSNALYMRAAGVRVALKIRPAITPTDVTHYTHYQKMDQWFKVIVVRQKSRGMQGKFLHPVGAASDGAPFHFTRDVYDVVQGTEQEPLLWRKKTFNLAGPDDTNQRFFRHFQIVYERTFHLCDSVGPADGTTTLPEFTKRRLDDLKSLKRELNININIPYRRLVQRAGAIEQDQYNGLYMFVLTCNKYSNSGTPTEWTAANQFDDGIYYYSFDRQFKWYDVGDDTETS